MGLRPLRKLDRARTVHGTLTGLDLATRTVQVTGADGSRLVEPYDVLVISTGVSNGFWRRPGLQSPPSSSSTCAPRTTGWPAPGRSR